MIRLVLVATFVLTATANSQQALVRPVVERSPYTPITWETQKSTDGRESHHPVCPAGYMLYRGSAPAQTYNTDKVDARLICYRPL